MGKQPECVMDDCGKQPVNHAVPVCGEHLCSRCLMGAAVGRDIKAPYGGLCAACIDRDHILDAINYVSTRVEELHNHMVDSA